MCDFGIVFRWFCQDAQVPVISCFAGIAGLDLGMMEHGPYCEAARCVVRVWADVLAKVCSTMHFRWGPELKPG